MRSLQIPAILAAMAVLVSGCGGGSSSGGTGTVAVAITDAPFPATEDCLEAAWIVIDDVMIQGPNGWETLLLDEDEEEPEDQGDGKVTLDLLDLLNGIHASVAVGEVPTGRYHQIRLHIVETRLVFSDTTERTFKVPSGMQSGLKINPKPHLVVGAGETYEVELDFNIAESFHVTGSGGDPSCDDLKQGENQVIFNPVIHALNRDESGVISGEVTDEGEPAGGVEVSAFPADTVVDDTTTPEATTISGDGSSDAVPEGAYALRLLPGSYDLYIDTEGSGRVLVAEDVAVLRSQVTEQDLEVP